MIIFDTHELAWAAGFYDGEGSTIFSRTKSHRSLIVSAAQVDRRVLDRLQHAMGGFGHIRAIAARGNRQSSWFLRIDRFEHAQYAMAVLWTWLSPVKREQAARCLMAYRAETMMHRLHRDDLPIITTMFEQGFTDQESFKVMAVEFKVTPQAIRGRYNKWRKFLPGESGGDYN